MNKEEKRKMKTLELNSKEDFQYYLYQLICRSYKLIRQQDIYLLRLDNYICQKQRENVLMVTKNISVPYDVYVEFLKLLDDKYPKEDKIRIVLDNLKVHTSEATRKYLVTVPERFEFVFTPKHGSWLNMVEGFFSKTTRQMLRGIRVKFKEELTNRIYRYFAEINEEPIVFHGNIISMILMYRKKSLLIHCLSKSRVN